MRRHFSNVWMGSLIKISELFFAGTRQPLKTKTPNWPVIFCRPDLEFRIIGPLLLDESTMKQKYSAWSLNMRIFQHLTISTTSWHFSGFLSKYLLALQACWPNISWHFSCFWPNICCHFRFFYWIFVDHFLDFKQKIFFENFRIFDRDGDRSVSRGEMKGIVENLFHLIAESRREDKSPKEVKKKHS